MSGMLRELRLACRRLSARPMLVAVAVASMGLGIGVNTAVYSLFSAVFQQQPTAVDPDRLVRVEFGNGNHISYPNARDLLGTEAVDGMAAYAVTRVNLREGETTRSVRAMAVSPEFFRVVGLRSDSGREFSREDDAAVITEAFRRRYLSGRGSPLGQVLDVNGHAFTVVGVLSDRVQAVGSALAPDLYLPLIEPIVPALSDRRKQTLSLLARLRAGQSVSRAAVALTASGRWLEQAHPVDNAQLGTRAYVFPTSGLAAWQTREVPVSLLRAVAMVPFALFGIVLAIACANVAALLLAHGASRRREMAIRIALGSSRWQMAATMMAESLILALPGAIVGIALAHGLCRLAVTIALQYGPATPLLEIDGSVLLFATALAVLSALICGTLPAFELLRAQLPDPLGRAADVPHPRLLSRRALVVGQVIAATMLVLLAARSLRGLTFIQSVDPGFAIDEVATASIGLDPLRYQQDERLALAERCRDAVAALPGIEHASITSLIPLSGDVVSAGFEVERKPEERREARVMNVGTRYFETMRIRLLEGRDFGAADRIEAPAVAIVSQAFVDAHGLGDRALGTRVRRGDHEAWAEIVGVVADSKYAFFGETLQPIVYQPFSQAGGSVHIVAKTFGRPAQILPALRSTMARQDPRAIVEVQTLREATRMESTVRAIGSWTLATVGTLGLGLALVGLYGLIAYTVTLRKRELAVRLAVGATPSQLVRLVVGQAVSMVAVGFAIGTAIMLLVTHPFAFVFSGVAAADSAVLMTTSTLFLVAAAVAAYRPARQAAHTRPADELR